MKARLGLVFATFSVIMLTVALVGCGGQQRKATEAHFHKHRGKYDEIVRLVKLHGSYEGRLSFDPDKEFRITPRYGNSPGVWVDIQPTDAYFDLVYAETKAALNESSAMKDEGSVVKKLADHWYLVRRGWM